MAQAVARGGGGVPWTVRLFERWPASPLWTGAGFWLACRTVYLDIALARRFSRIGERETEPDLLRPGALAPFARHGLRSVLLWMGFTVLVALLFLQPYGQSIALPNLVATLAIAVAALLLPVVGVHRRLRAEKAAELERVNTAIARDRDALLAGAGEPRLADLVAYRGLVESLPTWPLDLTVWLRFALYVAIGGGSWLGAALVERGLDRALGG